MRLSISAELAAEMVVASMLLLLMSYNWRSRHSNKLLYSKKMHAYLEIVVFVREMQLNVPHGLINEHW